MVTSKQQFEKQADELYNHLLEIAKNHGITVGQAADVWYFRTRSRWTQELENQLIAEFRNNQPVGSIMEYGVKDRKENKKSS